MTQMLNPYDAAGGFGIAEMTESLNILPNTYGMINRMGLFADEGVTQTTVLVDIKEGVLNLLPSVPRGGPATVGNRDSRTLRAFVIPHIPHNDVIIPDDIQGVRAFGQTDSVDPLARIMSDRQMKMRTKHAQTLEYMRIQAMKGILKDGAGVTLVNFFTEFGITKKTIDFVLGTTTTDVPSKVRELKRYISKNLNGESMDGVVAMLSPSLWDKFIKHTSVTEAFKYYNDNQGQQPMRNDTRDGFKFHGVTFMEYDATFTLADGSTVEDAFATDYGVAFPTGTTSTFKTHYAPANWMETVNTLGIPMYARQNTRTDGTGIDLLTQSNPLPIVRRPKLIVEVRSSN